VKNKVTDALDGTISGDGQPVVGDGAVESHRRGKPFWRFPQICYVLCPMTNTVCTTLWAAAHFFQHFVKQIVGVLIYRREE